MIAGGPPRAGCLIAAQLAPRNTGFALWRGYSGLRGRLLRMEVPESCLWHKGSRGNGSVAYAPTNRIEQKPPAHPHHRPPRPQNSAPAPLQLADRGRHPGRHAAEVPRLRSCHRGQRRQHPPLPVREPKTTTTPHTTKVLTSKTTGQDPWGCSRDDNLVGLMHHNPNTLTVSGPEVRVRSVGSRPGTSVLIRRSHAGRMDQIGTTTQGSRRSIKLRTTAASPLPVVGRRSSGKS